MRVSHKERDPYEKHTSDYEKGVVDEIALVVGFEVLVQASIHIVKILFFASAHREFLGFGDGHV